MIHADSIPLIVMTLAFMGSLLLNGCLVWWMLRSEGRIKPSAVERTEAMAKIPVKPAGKSYGGKVV